MGHGNESSDPGPRFLTLPALRELTLGSILVYTPLIRFLSRCRPPLRRVQLKLDDAGIEASEPEFFQLLPALASLHLELCSGAQFSQFLTSLHAHTSTSFLPNLTACTITMTARGWLSAAAGFPLLADALASRWESRSDVAKLQQFIFTHPHGSLPGSQVLERLSDLIQQGMSIRLEAHDSCWP